MLTGIIDVTALLEYLNVTALYIRVISILMFMQCTIVDAQVLAVILEVILVNFNELILKLTQL